MPAVTSARRRLANRLAVACVIAITVVMLVPIYWTLAVVAFSYLVYGYRRYRT